MHVNACKCRNVFVNEMELTCWMIDTMNRTRFNPLQRQEKTAWLSCKEMSAYRTPCAPVKLPSGFKCHNWHETCWWERAMYLLCALLPSCPHLILPLSTPCPPLAPNLLFILLSFFFFVIYPSAFSSLKESSCLLLCFSTHLLCSGMICTWSSFCLGIFSTFYSFLLLCLFCCLLPLLISCSFNSLLVSFPSSSLTYSLFLLLNFSFTLCLFFFFFFILFF